GCTEEAILAEIGLTTRDLFPQNGNGTRKAPVNRETVYEIREPDGTLVAEHVRRDRVDSTKDVLWRLPGSTEFGLNGRIKLIDLPLYGSELLRALPDGATVVVCEGEKATDALRARGIASVGTVTGASMTPSKAVLQMFARFAVVLWPDL